MDPVRIALLTGLYQSQRLLWIQVLNWTTLVATDICRFPYIRSTIIWKYS